MEKEKASERMAMRVTPLLKQRIEAQAAEEGRTPSNLIINIITQYLDRIDEAKRTLKGIL